MKTTPNMTDAERMEAWLKVTTLEEAVEEALKHQEWAASSDPYYADLTQAIWAMIERCHNARTL